MLRHSKLSKLMVKLTEPMSARAVNSSSIYYTATISCIIEINNKQFALKAYVCKNICMPLILGYDFLRGNKICLDFTHAPTNPVQVPIVTKRQFYVKPYSTFAINSAIQIELCASLLVSQAQTFNHPHIVVLPTLTNPDRNVIKTYIVNTSSETQWIPTGEHIADFAQVAPHDTVAHILDPPTTQDVPSTPSRQPQASHLDVLADKKAPPSSWTDKKELFKELNISPQLSESQKDDIQRLAWNFRDIFYKDGDRLKPSKLPQMSIQLKPDFKPWTCPNYRFSPAQLDVFKREIKKLLDLGIIERANTPYLSPAFLVSKPDGSARLIIDLRALNSSCILPASPLPLPDFCIDVMNRKSN